MECKSIVVCMIVGVLGLISTVVGLVFELAPDKTMVHLFYWYYVDYNCTDTDCIQCEYFRSAAFYLVLAAIVSVIVAQIVITISADCGCCSGRASSSAVHTLAIMAFFFSWLSCIGAVIVYIIGGAKQYGVQFPEFWHFFTSLGSIWTESSQCYKVENGLFGAAAAFSFVAATLGIITYLALVLGDNRRRRISNVRANTTTELRNDHGNAPPSPMDNPIAIALPDVPALPVRRFAAPEHHQTAKEQRRIPVMVEA